MHFPILIILSATLSLVSSQSPSDLPKCAQGCLGTSLNIPGCSNIDIKCICTNQNWLSGLSCCVRGSCSGDDLQNTINYAQSICKAGGVNINTSLGLNCPSSTGSASSGTATGATAGTTSSVSLTSSSSATVASATSTKSNPAPKNAMATGGILAGGAAAALLALI